MEARLQVCYQLEVRMELLILPVSIINSSSLGHQTYRRQTSDLAILPIRHHCLAEAQFLAVNTTTAKVTVKPFIHFEKNQKIERLMKFFTILSDQRLVGRGVGVAKLGVVGDVVYGGFQPRIEGIDKCK